MKRFPKAALVTANVLMLIALACSNERVIGPVEAALEDVLALISGDDGNALDVGSDGLLYVEVSEPEATNLLSADSANALHIGSDGLLYAAVLTGGEGGEGPRGPEGPEGPEGPQGSEGPQGPPGTSVTIVGSVGQANQLPNNAEPGDGWLVNGDLWVWSGDGWNNVGRIQGPPGERGPEGPQGQRGPEGAQGERGQRGPAGEQGPAGPEGEQGEKGDPGQDGAKGDKGDKGDPGAPGVGLSVKRFGRGIDPDLFANPYIDIDDPDQRIAGGLVFLQCHMEDQSDFFSPVPCSAYLWEGSTRIAIDMRNPPHDTGWVTATLMGNFD